MTSGAVKTPWGRIDALRAHGPPRGWSALSPDQLRRRQRKRLFGAMVASVAERGYAATTVEHLVQASGVSRAHFYRYFKSKQDCFLQAVDRLHRRGIERLDAAYEGAEGDLRERFGVAFRALVELIREEPAAARMCVVELYAAGAEARGRADRAVEDFAAELGRAFGESEPYAGLPEEVARAICGGLHMLVHDRLREGAEAELEGSVEDLIAWALCYEAPRPELREPEAAEPPAPPPPSDEPRERLLRATAALAAEEGYPGFTVNEIAARAGTSMRALYEHFADKEDALLACYDRAVDGALRATQAGYARGSDWPESIHAANRALLEYLATEPELARVATVEVLAAGTEALARRDRVIEPFIRMADPGFERAPGLPRVWAEANCFAVYSLIYREITMGDGPAALPRLGPTLTFVDLAPFLGAERAAEVANRPAKQVRRPRR